MIYCYCGNAKTRTILNKKYKSFSHIDEKNCKDPLVYIVKQCNIFTMHYGQVLIGDVWYLMKVLMLFDNTNVPW